MRVNVDRFGFLAAALATSLGLLSTRALALQQAGGTPIPVLDPAVTICSDRNVQVCLDAEEGGATIDALAAAAVTPETYQPGCALTFRVLARGAGFLNTFGWYNVNPNGPPPDADLHAFLLCDDAVGTTKVLDIAADPAYLGGPIGFFMATPEGTADNCPQFFADGGPVPGTVGYVYYSEPAHNPDNVGPDSWIHLITYDSVAYPSSFYFAWEDLLSGGDNDFDDLLTRVEGIQCLGGGVACDTGLAGECAAGLTQCSNGLLQCVGRRDATDESCNALDDDCNGLLDDGQLCPPDQICFQGRCQPRCGGGEFNCPTALECNAEGLCVEPACLEADCVAGQVCVGGDCQGWCDGIACPFGLECRAGACFDPCEAVVCEPDFVCDRGVCVLECGCGGCSGELSCELSSGRCVEDGCVDVACEAGWHCETPGVCVDSCDGAICPAGHSCVDGRCEPQVNEGGGGAGGSGGGGPGGFAFGGGGSSPEGGSGPNVGGGSFEPPTPADARGTCGCRLPGEGREPLVGGAFGTLALVVLAARRRRSARS